MDDTEDFRSYHLFLPRVHSIERPTPYQYKIHTMSPSFSTQPPSCKYALLSFPTPSILLVTLNRPKSLNCINIEGHIELDGVWRWLDDEPSLHIAIVTGTGRAFCAGADLKGRHDLVDTHLLRGFADTYPDCRMGQSTEIEPAAAHACLRLRRPLQTRWQKTRYRSRQRSGIRWRMRNDYKLRHGPRKL